MNLLLMRTHYWARLACCACFLVVGVAPAVAGTITLTDQNSSVIIDPNSNSGLENWSVEGQNQLNQEWFWYRLSGGSLSSIDTLGSPTISNTAAPNVATIAYSGTNGLTTSVNYTLNGDVTGSDDSQITELISLKNSTSTAMTLQFFEYANLTLLGSATGDVVQFQNKTEVDQTKYGLQGNLMASESMSNTDNAPAANYREAGEVNGANGYPDILAGLTSGSLTQLSGSNTNTGSPLYGVPGGDMTWAYEWDHTIPPGGTFQISKLKSVQGVPEPSTLAIALVGFLGLIGFALQRRIALRLAQYSGNLKIPLACWPWITFDARDSPMGKLSACNP
jgi:hypothetical protein